MTAPTKLDAGIRRRDGAGPRVFRRGAHFPFAVRWFGVTMLFGHARSMIASAIASEQIDSRDWMRPQGAAELLRAVLEALGGDLGAKTLVEGIGRPVWIDFVADTGDDRDVSAAVGRMLFRDYEVLGRKLPRGDLLLFGGDTAYPVATVEEIQARVIEPWSEALEAEAPPYARRVLLGVPGNHDWYDGLDGFARLFRVDAQAAVARESMLPGDRVTRVLGSRKAGFLVRHLHLDEWGAFFRILRDFGVAVSALWRQRTVSRRKRLALPGYESVQEATYFCFPLAPGLDVFGVDRQLSRLDFRQRSFFRRRRAENPDARVLFVAPDPALAFDEPWKLGQAMLHACKLDLEADDVLYMTGDMHHYERRKVGARSVHVIAGGGGAFLHGTRLRPGPGGPPDAVYPGARACRRLVGQVPLRLMLGGSGFLIHFGFAALAAIELAASLRGFFALGVAAACVSLGLALTFHLTARSGSAHPRRVAALALPFGVVLGVLPMVLRMLLARLVHLLNGQSLRALGVASVLASDTAVIVVYSFLGALGFGLFLTTLALAGLEHQQAYAALSHPGYKHFVRLCVHPGGKIEAWTIGKDDPLAPEDAALVDRWEWGG